MTALKEPSLLVRYIVITDKVNIAAAAADVPVISDASSSSKENIGFLIII
jgi:hypothetical protein